jgi:pyridoxal phosphate enzyme (YggS family)
MNLEFRDRFDEILNRVERRRKEVSLHHIVQIVAVTKYVDSDAIEKLYSIGQRAVGENKIQDFEKKSKELSNLPIQWHFIGNLQKNKINKMLELKPSLFQSLDSLELAEAISLRLGDRKLKALLQINTGDSKKSGVDFEKAKDTYSEISERFPNIELQGVMSIGEKGDISSFSKTRKVFDSISEAKICSMGMSGDFEEAISEGSNMIRIGSVLFK